MEKENDFYLTKSLKAKKFKEICYFFHQKNLEEFYLKENGTEIILKKKQFNKLTSKQVNQNPITTSSSTIDNTIETKKQEEEGFNIMSPIAGVFYSSPSPETSPFVKEGDIVKKGQIVAIVEAMKIMNEITSPKKGTINKILVKNGDVITQGANIMLLL